MSKPSTGSPAFPEVRILKGDNYNPITKVYYPGMTMRDYFAASALQGYLASLPQNSGIKPDLAAKAAYEIADAMIRARESA